MLSLPNVDVVRMAKTQIRWKTCPQGSFMSDLQDTTTGSKQMEHSHVKSSFAVFRVTRLRLRRVGFTVSGNSVVMTGPTDLAWRWFCSCMIME